MEKSSASHALKLALLLALLVLVISKEKESLNGHIEVSIYNDLKGNVTLSVHCTGPHEDLGKVLIIKGQPFSWKIDDGFPKRYYCEIKWNEKKHTIKAYSTVRDEGRCHDKCCWSIKDDCAYSFNEKKKQNEPLDCW